MNRDVLLSIAIPSYNRANYLLELLPLISEQLSLVDAELNIPKVECFVLDNASTDDTEKIVNYFSNKIIYYKNNVNIGADANFIECVKRATGRYVWLFGDDDIILPNRLLKVVDILNCHSPSLLIVKEKTYVYNNNQYLYDSYQNVVNDLSTMNPHFFLAHTLITTNVFQKNVFNLKVAKDYVLTNYGHMYGLMSMLDNDSKVYITEDDIIQVRDIRAEFSDTPQNLLYKQYKYLKYIAHRYTNIKLWLYSHFFYCSQIFKKCIIDAKSVLKKMIVSNGFK